MSFKLLLFKLAAIVSFCGGPLLLHEITKPHEHEWLAFVLAFLPVGLMAWGSLALDSSIFTRWEALNVALGGVGAVISIPLHLFAAWYLGTHSLTPDRALYVVGISIGLASTVLYLYFARRWARSYRSRVVLAAALAGLTALCSAAAGAAPPPGTDVTERIREILREDRGDSVWGADPPAEETAARGEPFAATALSGTGHALVVIGKDGRPMGSHLRLLHVSVEGARASASDCVLRLGQDEDRSCPPAPLALVDCATWSVPADAARAALLQARAALFVRVYEKKFIADPREEIEASGPVSGGVAGSVAGGSSVDFVAVANVMESGEHPIRVAEEWAGYVSSADAGRYARADAATDILREAFPRPSDAPASAPPPALHAEFSRLFATLPLDADFWWWVRERMVLMSADLGLPADLARLKRYLTPKDRDPSDLRTRAYALEALARRTRRDTRCDGGRRLADKAAAAAWAAARAH